MLLRTFCVPRFKRELDETEEEGFIESPENVFVDTWLERASTFGTTCKAYDRIVERLTFIPNRQLFFDINRDSVGFERLMSD